MYVGHSIRIPHPAGSAGCGLNTVTVYWRTLQSGQKRRGRLLANPCQTLPYGEEPALASAPDERAGGTTPKADMSLYASVPPPPPPPDSPESSAPGLPDVDEEPTQERGGRKLKRARSGAETDVAGARDVSMASKSQPKRKRQGRTGGALWAITSWRRETSRVPSSRSAS